MDTKLSRIRCFNGSALKLLALLTMTIDHATVAMTRYFPFYARHYYLLRGIGRIAFPIYCFLLVEGYHHTRNVKRYLGRLLAMAFLSEIPFDLALFDQCPDWTHQNVMLTLLIGLSAVALVDHAAQWAQDIANDEETALLLGAAIRCAVILLSVGLAEWLETDYGGGGVIVILLFYFLRKHPFWLTIALFAALYGLFWWFEAIGILAMIPILLYNGKRGPVTGKAVKWFFYLYYPAHLLLLGILFPAI